jgi:hypothetical protein
LSLFMIREKSSNFWWDFLSFDGKSSNLNIGILWNVPEFLFHSEHFQLAI